MSSTFMSRVGRLWWRVVGLRWRRGWWAFCAWRWRRGAAGRLWVALGRPARYRPWPSALALAAAGALAGGCAGAALALASLLFSPVVLFGVVVAALAGVSGFPPSGVRRPAVRR